jgi:hypothetical protein
MIMLQLLPRCSYPMGLLRKHYQTFLRKFYDNFTTISEKLRINVAIKVRQETPMIVIGFLITSLSLQKLQLLPFIQS